MQLLKLVSPTQSIEAPRVYNALGDEEEGKETEGRQVTVKSPRGGVNR